jgi:hypothetical protein
MKKLILMILLIVGAALACSIITVIAQGPMVAWPFFGEIRPRAGAAGTFGLVVPNQVMDKAREDLADLRLYDAVGHEIPYALRIRKEIDDNREVAARTFNEATRGSTTSEVSVDLGENAGEHNEVEVETTGTNFRRRVDLEGSDSNQEWRTLKTGIIFRFESQNGFAQSKRVSYSTSRYRYLRVRVFADELTDEQQAPIITGVKVVMAVRARGELTTWSVPVAPYQLLRNQGALASAWNIDLGARVPCDRLMLEIGDESFSRPFQLETLDDPDNIHLVASGELTRQSGAARQPLLITFDNEVQTRKLRLRITDYSNQTLTIVSITAGAPQRQLVFDLKQTSDQPLRLFFGNPSAMAPHYDFERNLPATLASEPMGTEISAIAANPDYRPEPLPLTERIPWLIYVVLGASSIALAIILLNLARTTLRSEAQSKEEAGS